MADNDIQNIARELAASGDPITAVGVDGKFTLRKAIANVFWKASSVIRLTSRPVDPRKPDDQFGHVMSMRSEVLINQAILQAVAAKLDIDFDDIRANVIRSLSA